VIVDPLVVCWPSKAEILYFHDLTIQRHGGLPGFQEGGEARLESTLIRPRNLLLYKDDATFPDLAATLIYGLAKNHCFNDGNKRVSAIAGGIFLAANGILWRPRSDELVKEILAIAASAPIGVQQSVGAGATGAGGCGATARLAF
jgi:death-on-curing protein